MNQKFSNSHEPYYKSSNASQFAESRKPTHGQSTSSLLQAPKISHSDSFVHGAPEFDPESEHQTNHPKSINHVKIESKR
jgi:hypothetical protein